jgi:hypothetical protein
MAHPTTPVTWSPEAITASGLKSSRDAQLWLESMGFDPAEIGDDDLPSAIRAAHDKQEVLSRKYGSDCLIVLPLSSGSIAVMSLDRQEHEIVTDEGNLLDTIEDCSRRYGTRMKAASIHADRLRELGAVEPDDRTLARDIRRSETPQRPSRRVASGPVELDLAEL